MFIVIDTDKHIQLGVFDDNWHLTAIILITLTSDGISQEGVGHSDQSAIIILVFPVVFGNRLNFHLSETQIHKTNHE